MKALDSMSRSSGLIGIGFLSSSEEFGTTVSNDRFTCDIPTDDFNNLVATYLAA